MADQKITQLTENTAPTFEDLLPHVDDPSGTPVTKKNTIANLLKNVILPQGGMINGKIAVSVASNNITVALKGSNGNDPSATNPVLVRIGDTIRVVTAALSVAKNAGTNWFNSGATGLATQEIDYFVYLGYNATDGVTIGFSRIPYANEYDDFSTTTTNDRYAAISTITNAAAGDDYELIGRFAATLSAGAGYTWTVPTYTNKNLIQRQIYETRWLSYTPTWTGFSSAPTGDNYYQIVGRKCFYSVVPAGTGTSNSASHSLSLPITTVIKASTYFDFVGRSIDNGTEGIGHAQMNIGSGTNTATINKGPNATGWTGSGASFWSGEIVYQI